MPPTRCGVAIVGGGVIGLSVARELARAGVGEVVVLEAERSVGQMSSARANGGVRAQFTTPINIQLSLYSIGELVALQEETGGLPGFHQAGYLMMTGTGHGARALESAAILQRSLGARTESLSPAEAKALAPFIRHEDLTAATFNRDDGFLDPSGLIAALREAIRGAPGVSIKTSSRVLEISRRDRGFHLVTEGGPVEAEWVVNAAGAWAGAVGEMLSEDVRVWPVRRNLAFAPDPTGATALTPMCVDLDTGVLVRKETGGGYVLAYSDPEDGPSWDREVDPLFLGQVAERIGHRFPALEDLEIDPRHCWAGSYPETADHHAIIGRWSDRSIVCAGFGGHGLMHSPAAGRAVAELVTSGRCKTFDLRPLRPQRFEEGDLTVETAVL
jgi:sarcosine oxidase subunit beta